MGHQEYLEKPYQDRYEEADAFEWYCEKYDMDPDDPETTKSYREYMDDEAEDRAFAMFDTRREYDEYLAEQGYWDP